MTELANLSTSPAIPYAAPRGVAGEGSPEGDKSCQFAEVFHKSVLSKSADQEDPESSQDASVGKGKKRSATSGNEVSASASTDEPEEARSNSEPRASIWNPIWNIPPLPKTEASFDLSFSPAGHPALQKTDTFSAPANILSDLFRSTDAITVAWTTTVTMPPAEDAPVGRRPAGVVDTLLDSPAAQEEPPKTNRQSAAAELLSSAQKTSHGFELASADWLHPAVPTPPVPPQSFEQAPPPPGAPPGAAQEPAVVERVAVSPLGAAESRITAGPVAFTARVVLDEEGTATPASAGAALPAPSPPSSSGSRELPRVFEANPSPLTPAPQKVERNAQSGDLPSHSGGHSPSDADPRTEIPTRSNGSGSESIHPSPFFLADSTPSITFNSSDPSPVSAPPPLTEVTLDLPLERLTPAPRELVLTIPSRAGGDDVLASVHVRDQNGAVEIAVRTLDSGLSNSLQESLPDLVQRLEVHGTEASASRGDHPDSNSSDSGNTQDPPQGQRGREPRDDRGSPQHQHREKRQERQARWQATLSTARPQ